jgi:hypothetical protein
MPSNTLNRDLLRQIADRIEREPERFNLSSWISGAVDAAEDLEHACGTTACVAGWANLLTGALTRDELADDARAARVLGLTGENEAGRLFLWTASIWCDLADDLGLTVLSPENPALRHINPRELTGVLAAKGLRMLANGEVTL